MLMLDRQTLDFSLTMDQMKKDPQSNHIEQWHDGSTVWTSESIVVWESIEVEIPFQIIANVRLFFFYFQ